MTKYTVITKEDNVEIEAESWAIGSDENLHLYDGPEDEDTTSLGVVNSDQFVALLRHDDATVIRDE